MDQVMDPSHRSFELTDCVIAFSISYQRDNLLARGMGLDHYDFAIVYDVLAAMAGVKGSVA